MTRADPTASHISNSNTSFELVSNELDVLARLLPLQHFARHGAGLSAIELGCGNARLGRELRELGLVTRYTGLEVDERQHAKNLATLWLAWPLCRRVHKPYLVPTSSLTWP